MAPMNFLRCHAFLVLMTLAWSGNALAAKVMIRFDGWDGPPIRLFVTRPVHLAADRFGRTSRHGHGSGL